MIFGSPGWQILGILALAAVAVIVATSLSSGDGAAVDASQPDPVSTTQAETKHQRCVNDAYAMAADIINNGDSGLQREVGVGGLDNPVLTIARTLPGVFGQTRVMNGRLAAQVAATTKASELCSAASDPTNDSYGGTPYTPPDSVNG